MEMRTDKMLLLKRSVMVMLAAWTIAQPAPPAAPATPFRYGIFMDANFIRGADDFRQRVLDLQARGFTTVLFTNNVMDRDEPLLDVADQLGFQVIFAPQGDLRYAWWSDDVPATIEAARSVIYPIAQRSSRHPSLVGYSILDDAPNRLANKAALAVQAFREADPNHPASPVFIGNNDAVYTASQPDVALTYEYSVLVSRPPCDLGSNGAQDGSDRITSTIRHVQQQNENVPIWFVLQAHGSTPNYQPLTLNPFALRDPTVEEMRLQHWIALGEGVKGIYWFAYDTEQFWTGLVDNPPLFDEATSLAARMQPLTDLLGGLSKVGDQFKATIVQAADGARAPYVSTLRSSTGALYVVVANHSCQPATLSVTSASAGGQLRDVEQDERYDLGSPIPFRGGDGRIFEVME
jgi:hypothetical protein